jgi:hypothetical protein
MSFHASCDICGKDSNLGKAVFNSKPIELVLENYKGVRFKAFLNVTISNEDDLNMIQTLQEGDDKKLSEMAKQTDLEIHTPNPHICIVCQKALAPRILEEGHIDPDAVYTPSMKVGLQKFMMPSNVHMFEDDIFDEFDEFDDDEEYDEVFDDEDEDEDN